jgi:hypothetical protein
MFPTPGQRAAEATTHVAAYGESARYWRINALEALWCGNGYEGRPSFWDTSVPLRDRAPAVQSMLPRTAGRRLVALVFGQRTFPSLTVEPRSFGVTLTDDDATALAALALDIVERGGLRARMRALMEAGLKSGSACAIVSICDGRPRVSIEPAKHCTPTLAPSGRVEKLVVQYKTPIEDGRLGWYRREIGDGVDLVRVCVPVDPKGEPEWSRVGVASKVAVPFTSVVWVRNLAEAEEESHGVDGHALVEGLEDEVYWLDMMLSMLTRNGAYNTDPQMVQVGVDSDAPMRAPTGQSATGFEWARGWIERLIAPSSGVAKKGPGTIWKLPQGGDAKLLESTGAGAQIAKGTIDELRRVVSDAIGVVLADPDTLGRGDMSAKALELMLGPMLDTASTLRTEYGAALVAIVDMALRLCSDATLAPGIYLPTLEAARPALAKLHRARTDDSTAWLGAPLTLRWPDLVEPTWTDVKSAVDVARAATGDSRVMSRRAALKMLAPVVGVEDIDAEAEAIDAEDGVSQGAVSDTLARLAEPNDDAPEVTLDDTDPMPAAVADTALNGAQVASMVEVVEKVAAGSLPRGAARAIIMRAFAVDGAGADEILGDAGQGFVPTAQTSPARDDGGTLGG